MGGVGLRDCWQWTSAGKLHVSQGDIATTDLPLLLSAVFCRSRLGGVGHRDFWQWTFAGKLHVSLGELAPTDLPLLVSGIFVEFGPRGIYYNIHVFSIEERKVVKI